MIRILLVDKQTIFRSGLSRLLARESDFEVAGEAQDYLQGVKLAGELKPDVVVMGLGMAEQAAWSDFHTLAAPAEDRRVIILASSGQKIWTTEAFRLGARGVVLRDGGSTALLVKAIRSVVNDRYWFEDREADDLAAVLQALDPDAAGARPRTYGLSPRELEVVSSVLAGHTNRQMAAMMSISQETVRHHMTNIFDKLGVYNRLELALLPSGTSTKTASRIKAPGVQGRDPLRCSSKSRAVVCGGAGVGRRPGQP